MCELFKQQPRRLLELLPRSKMSEKKKLQDTLDLLYKLSTTLKLMGFESFSFTHLEKKWYTFGVEITSGDMVGLIAVTRLLLLRSITLWRNFSRSSG
ncbi:hypothetical protein OUZ56_008108 [Daphnia magna]|uniref:Uncharacterized protein n=1 Tax=Daphnia magna TaxID=35525 RepID=A0ABR0ABY4_9CRUS|nr:hypothetical protein OUZ56_008108 [Daphnia magna]